MSSSWDEDDYDESDMEEEDYLEWLEIRRLHRSRRRKVSTNPIKTLHGIRAVCQQGKFGAEWWSQRWIQIIESYHLGVRLTRGKSYARMGQVLSIEFMPGLIFAVVQGTRPKPYEVSIKLLTWSDAEWEKVVNFIQFRPEIMSQLFSNRLPPSLEAELSLLGLYLFPQQFVEFSTDCSCPDWSNPCKHIAAVFYLIAEALEKNPFLLFELRGRDRESFLEMLLPQEGLLTETDLDGGSVALSLEHFWREVLEETELVYFPEEITQSAGIIHQMGPFPMWQGQQNFFVFWEQQYKLYTQLALKQLATVLNTTNENRPHLL